MKYMNLALGVTSGGVLRTGRLNFGLHKSWRIYTADGRLLVSQEWMCSKELDDASVYQWIYLWRTVPRKTHCCFTDLWTRNDRVLNQPTTKDCHNKILAVCRQSEHDKAFKTQTAVSTDVSQNLIYKLLVDVAWSPIPVKCPYNEHKAA